jgi:hypothetical protein
MVAMLNGENLKNKIYQYLIKVIARPRKKIGGFAICPFLKRYLNNIQIIITQDYSKTLDTTCQLLGPLGLEAVVISGYDMDYDKLEHLVNKKTRKFKKQDIEILFMHPETVEPPLPLNYTFKYAPLIIVQRKSTLQNARKTLKNKTNYYKYHK